MPVLLLPFLSSRFALFLYLRLLSFCSAVLPYFLTHSLTRSLTLFHTVSISFVRSSLFLLALFHFLPCLPFLVCIASVHACTFDRVFRHFVYTFLELRFGPGTSILLIVRAISKNVKQSQLALSVDCYYLSCSAVVAATAATADAVHIVCCCCCCCYSCVVGSPHNILLSSFVPQQKYHD